MTRRILSLAVVAAFAIPAAANAEALPVRTYPVYCGYTLMYQCGQCVEVGTYTNCTYW